MVSSYVLLSDFWLEIINFFAFRCTLNISMAVRANITQLTTVRISIGPMKYMSIDQSLAAFEERI